MAARATARRRHGGGTAAARRRGGGSTARRLCSTARRLCSTAARQLGLDLAGLGSARHGRRGGSARRLSTARLGSAPAAHSKQQQAAASSSKQQQAAASSKQQQQAAASSRATQTSRPRPAAAQLAAGRLAAAAAAFLLPPSEAGGKAHEHAVQHCAIRASGFWTWRLLGVAACVPAKKFILEPLSQSPLAICEQGRAHSRGSGPEKRRDAIVRKGIVGMMGAASDLRIMG